eukprot:CAMPEP_0197333014 /NCGR_PEP_ID=MMETSP0892-20130614/22877_1 /TAXON_ID=44058 ORGANISM="Aureoumbra lagunensis, Strain CCMP1510" /NCGR_SAMPLE_ID=MMETSP0892 /ASSEMBLY_ACC=CAM_ASM_000538 /LENGTH=48 /DNA_ID= /DNA_START= /DNA_END= /DNA_ORIENTATION=
MVRVFPVPKAPLNMNGGGRFQCRSLCVRNCEACDVFTPAAKNAGSSSA